MINVSVIIPCYNSKYLDYSIETVIAQTFSDYEIILIDDCSTDDTFQRIQEYALNYEKISAHRNSSNIGPGATRNIGLKFAKGKYVAFLDSDDLWDPTKLEKQVAFLEDHQDVDIVYCHINGMGNNEKIAHTFISEGNVKDIMLYGPICVPSTVMARTCNILAVGGFGEHVRVAEDWYLWLKLSVVSKFGCVGEKLCMRRTHPDQISNNYDIIIRDDNLVLERFLKEHDIGRFRAYKARTFLLFKCAFYLRSKGDRGRSTLLYFQAWLLAPWRFSALKGAFLNLLKWEMVRRDALRLNNI